MTYDCLSELLDLDFSALLPTLDRATAHLVRFDERLRVDSLAEGLRQRMHFAETLAIAREEGDLIHMEDLVLRDAGLFTRAGDYALSRALLTLKSRRQAAGGDPAWALSDAGLTAITGANREPGVEWADAQSQILAPDARAFDRLRVWRDGLSHLDKLPPVLAAALAYDAWVRSPPLLQNAAIGGVLVSCYLRALGLVQFHLPVLTVGIRIAGFRPLAERSATRRICGFMAAVGESARHGMKELARLTNAREVMALKLQGRRRSSHLPALVDLLLSRPLITIPMAAKCLGISQQAVAGMLPQLGATPRELTDRDSYRAWGIL